MDSLLSRLKGHWSGRKKLWLAPGKSVSECDISADVTDTSLGRAAVIEYAWFLEGERQEGHLVLNTDFGKGCVQAAWVDSFHMATGIMILKGEFVHPNTVDLMGSYASPPGPDWGWRMVIRAPEDHSMELICYNVTPDGEEHLAIEVLLKRSAR